MNTCLVVDDMEIRHAGFKKILGGKVKLLRADNCTEAVSQVREAMFDDAGRIDAMFLDHDIESGVDQRDVNHFVNWMVENDWVRERLRLWQTKFFIHSHNPIGADNMRFTLQENGFDVIVRRFEAQ